jgi:pilus assembly protein CpaC
MIMNRNTKTMRTPIALAIVLAFATTASQAPLAAQSGKVARSASQMPINAQRTSRGGAADLNISVGRGQLINLSAPISDVFVSNENVADVQVRSSTQIYVLAKAAGESTVYATSSSGAVVYSANVRVGTNVSSIGDMLRLAMPDAEIVATPMNGMVLLTGTVRGPEDTAGLCRRRHKSCEPPAHSNAAAG